jgi:hypothetical protein
LLVLIPLLAGCKFKHVEDDSPSVSLEGGTEKHMAAMALCVVPAQPKDMDVTVTATTTPAAPVTLYLVLSADAESVETDLEFGREPTKVLAKAGPAENPTLTGVAPANKECSVEAANASGKPTEVKAHIVGKY